MDENKLITHEVIPIELAKITNSIKASLANLEKCLEKKNIEDKLQESKDLGILIQKHIELMSIDVAKLSALRVKHWATRLNGELGHESRFEEDQKVDVRSIELDTPKLTPSTLGSKQTRKLMRGITLWQDILQNLEILTRSKLNPLMDFIADDGIRKSFWRTLENTKNTVSPKAVTSNLVEISNAPTITTQDVIEYWRAFWKSLEESDVVHTEVLLKIGYQIQAITKQHKPLALTKYVVDSIPPPEENPSRDAQKLHAADNRTEENEAFPQIWTPIRMEWHRLRRFRKTLIKSKFYEEDFESYDAFQWRTGSTEIAKNQLAIKFSQLLLNLDLRHICGQI